MVGTSLSFHVKFVNRKCWRYTPMDVKIPQTLGQSITYLCGTPYYGHVSKRLWLGCAWRVLLTSLPKPHFSDPSATTLLSLWPLCNNSFLSLWPLCNNSSLSLSVTPLQQPFSLSVPSATTLFSFPLFPKAEAASAGRGCWGGGGGGGGGVSSTVFVQISVAIFNFDKCFGRKKHTKEPFFLQLFICTRPSP